jgi:hypothetical protein
VIKRYWKQQTSKGWQKNKQNQSVTYFWQTLQAMGIAPLALLQQARLSPALLAADGYLTREQFFSIWQVIENDRESTSAHVSCRKSNRCSFRRRFWCPTTRPMCVPRCTALCVTKPFARAKCSISTKA